jgi:hypothetical protein
LLPVPGRVGARASTRSRGAHARSAAAHYFGRPGEISKKEVTSVAAKKKSSGGGKKKSSGGKKSSKKK